jgi:hypothetical protein
MIELGFLGSSLDPYITAIPPVSDPLCMIFYNFLLLILSSANKWVGYLAHIQPHRSLSTIRCDSISSKGPHGIFLHPPYVWLMLVH